MARANHVKKAAKDYPDAGIKKGEPYYWWKFRYGSKRFSKTMPRRSQLTQSEFLGTIYSIEERLEDLSAKDGIEAIVSERDAIVEELRDLASEQDDKRSNMPDSLQDSETGQLLEERQSEVEQFADDLEAVDLDIEQDGEGEAAEEEFEQKVQDAIAELQAVSYNGS